MKFNFKVGIEPAEALRMVSLYPAQVMNKTGLSGKIEKGDTANLVFLNENFDVQGIVAPS